MNFELVRDPRPVTFRSFWSKKHGDLFPAPRPRVSPEKSFLDIFMADTPKNRQVFDLYNKFTSDPYLYVGYYEIPHSSVILNWGLVIAADKCFNLLPGFGWHQEHFPYLIQKKRLAHYTTERVTLNESSILSTINIDSAVLLSFPGALTYGHWISDIIARLEIIDSMIGLKKIPCFLLAGPYSPWMDRFLSAFGVDRDRCVFIGNDRRIEVDRLLVPTTASQAPGGVLVEPVVAQAVDRLASLFNAWKRPVSSRAPMCFVEHTPLTSPPERLLSNRDELKNSILSIGGLVANPLQDSAFDFVSKIASTKCVIGQDSSALHNIAFAPQDLFVIETEPRANMIHVSLQNISDKRISYVNADKTTNGWCVDLSAITSQLEHLLDK